MVWFILKEFCLIFPLPAESGLEYTDFESDSSEKEKVDPDPIIIKQLEIVSGFARAAL